MRCGVRIGEPGAHLHFFQFIQIAVGSVRVDIQGFILPVFGGCPRIVQTVEFQNQGASGTDAFQLHFSEVKPAEGKKPLFFPGQCIRQQILHVGVVQYGDGGFSGLAGIPGTVRTLGEKHRHGGAWLFTGLGQKGHGERHSGIIQPVHGKVRNFVRSEAGHFSLFNGFQQRNEMLRISFLVTGALCRVQPGGLDAFFLIPLNEAGDGRVILKTFTDGKAGNLVIPDVRQLLGTQKAQIQRNIAYAGNFLVGFRRLRQFKDGLTVGNGGFDQFGQASVVRGRINPERDGLFLHLQGFAVF